MTFLLYSHTKGFVRQRGIITSGLNHVVHSVFQELKYGPNGKKFKTIKNVVNGQKHVPYDGNCYDAALEQVENGGGRPSNPLNAKQMYVNNYLQIEQGKPELNADVNGGVLAIQNSLKDGIPVLVGVSYGNELLKNHNMLTDHFIVIVGQGYDSLTQQNYFSFYDNVGTNPTNLNLNRLHYSNGVFIGPSYQQGSNYIMTEVRPNISWFSKYINRN